MGFEHLIRTIPDFPEPGIQFRDITPLLDDPEAFGSVIHQMAATFRDQRIDKVVGIESRGFMFGAPLALDLGAGFIPVRKPGKLPADTLQEAYTLEYGTAALEIHGDALGPEHRVLVVDDVLATGGTLAAAIRLVQRLQGQVVGAAVLIELVDLQGRAKLGDVPLESLVRYGG